jgi:hypothetical protein
MDAVWPMLIGSAFGLTLCSSAVAGTVVEVDQTALKAIRALPSYTSEMIGVDVGAKIEKTVDLLTSYGQVNLINSSHDALEADYQRFHEIVECGIFKVAAAAEVK